MKHYGVKLLKKIRLFFSQKKAVVAIEMAFILPIFMMLTMGIMEYALIFSIRTGIEEVARQVSRTRLSTRGDIDIIGASAGDTNADVLTQLYEKLLGVVGNGNMENVRVCSKFSNTMSGLVSLASDNGGCQTFTNAQPTYTASASAPVVFGNSRDYVAIRITYTHKYLTPLGAFATGLGNNLQMTSFIYYKRED